MTDKQFNKWFSIFILVGMISAVVVVNIFKFQDPSTRKLIQLIATVGAVMGVVNTVLSAGGNIWTFVFGLIDVICCSIVTYDSGVMGSFALHVLYFLPMQFVGWWQWRKRGATFKASEGESEVSLVKARRLTPKGWAFLACGFVVGAAVLYFILYQIDKSALASGTISSIDKQKVALDTLVVTLNILGQVLLSMAYTEQWHIWILVNISSILLWTNRLLASGGDYQLVMVIKYCFYLLNSLNGLRVWLKLSRTDGQAPAHTSACC